MQSRCAVADRITGGVLVCRVDVAVQKADGDGIDAPFCELAREAGDVPHMSTPTRSARGYAARFGSDIGVMVAAVSPFVGQFGSKI
jgi:hypothetical protein